MMQRTPVLRLAIVTALLLATPIAISAQPRETLRGTVRSRAGVPIAGANVFVIESLEGTLTDSTGSFAFAISVPRPLTLLVKRLGFEEFRSVLSATDTGPIAVTLDRGAPTLAPITVQAGAYTASEERGATLTALEIVTTPGTSADINRAIQLLPGVQSVDDGTALFVRGGDYTETKVFMNEAPLLNPAQLLTPTGTFVGTVDPFQLDGIFFSSGGFGVRYGNALSGVVGLQTRGRSTGNSFTLGAGLAALSADGALRANDRWTFRVAGNRTDLSPFFRINGNPRGFEPAPNGHDVSLSTTFTYRPTGELKAFFIDQSNLVGVAVNDPAFSGTFNSKVNSRLSVVTWKDIIGPVSILTSASQGDLDRREDFGVFRLGGDQRQRQLFTQMMWEVRPGVSLRTGGEVEHVLSSLAGSLPATEADGAPGSRAVLFNYNAPGARGGAFVEVDWQTTGTLRVTPGIRSDHSTLTGQRTIDPRVAAAWRPVDGVVVTGALGIYHQIADPLFYDDSIGRSDLPPMRARQWVLGAQIGEAGPVIMRAEAYGKRYTNVVAQGRNNQVRAGGEGTSRGVDLFIKGSLPFGITTRSTLSYLVAERTDATTGILARAPFDVTWSRAFIAERAFASGLRAGLTWRTSTGRPFTPVTGATFDSTAGNWLPRYGAPFSERFPELNRVDVSLSGTRGAGSLLAVWYLSLSNAFGSDNTQSWSYSRDYSSRTPLRSIFARSVYFGVSLIKP